VQRLPCEPIGNCQQFFQDSRQLLLHKIYNSLVSANLRYL
jgi:hypothetical protein